MIHLKEGVNNKTVRTLKAFVAGLRHKTTPSKNEVDLLELRGTIRRYVRRMGRWDTFVRASLPDLKTFTKLAWNMKYAFIRKIFPVLKSLEQFVQTIEEEDDDRVRLQKVIQWMEGIPLRISVGGLNIRKYVMNYCHDFKALLVPVEFRDGEVYYEIEHDRTDGVVANMLDRHLIVQGPNESDSLFPIGVTYTRRPDEPLEGEDEEDESPPISPFLLSSSYLYLKDKSGMVPDHWFMLGWSGNPESPLNDS